MAGISFLRAKRRILMMGEDGIVLFSSGSSGVEREGALPWTLPNFGSQLTDMLQRKNRQWPVFVLFDANDQTYRPEVLPKVSSLDQPKMLRRKLDAAFPTYPVRAALRIKDKKNKDGGGPKYLFAALPDTGMLENVARTLYAAEVPIGGLSLLPVESADLVAALAKSLDFNVGQTSQWRVLITQNETGGLRQVVVKDGRLVLTRMIQIAEENMTGVAWVDEVVREFKASLSYLSRLKYVPAEGLDVMVVCGETEKQAFTQKQQMFQATRLQCLTADEAMAALGLKLIRKQIVKPIFGDIIHAGWLGQKSSLMMPVSMPAIAKVQKPRAVAKVAVGLLVLGALGSGGMLASDWQDYMSLQEEVEQQSSQQALLQREYDDESKIFNELPIRPEVVRAAMNVRKLLDDNSMHPGRIFEIVRRALGSDVVVETIKLTHAPGAQLPVSGGGGPGRAAMPVPGAKDNGKINLTFSYSLSKDMTLEQRVSHTEGVVRQLRSMLPDYKVQVTSQFGKVSRTGRFSGKIGEATNSSRSTGNLDAKETAEIVIEGAPL